MNLKTGDKVIVTCGKDKNKQGKIIKTLAKEDKVIVEGVNVVKKHIKPKNNGGTGEIREVEAPIHRSNVKVEEAKKEVKASKKTKKENK